MKLKTLALALSAFPFLAQAYHSTPEPILDNGKGAYAVDANNEVVRDNFYGCVRSRDWTPDTAIPACEGQTKTVPEASTPTEASQARASSENESTSTETSSTPVTQAAPVVTATASAPDSVSEPASESATTVTPPPKWLGHFDHNGASISATDQSQMQEMIDYAKANPSAKLTVSGHTDSQGSNRYNNKLSLKRANQVKAYLIDQGVQAEQIETIGQGESQPIADNATEDGRAMNRRVEIEVQ